ncbi:MAG TPA: histidine phosphatase family protein [Lactobacillaceae bacterium]|jgi:broad specificity phosphatase PhoE
MHVIFVRHSEPDYTMLTTQDWRDFGRDLAPLSANGRRLAQLAAENSVIDTAQIVISSSITRALETATYLVRDRDVPLVVEPFFHEWRPDVKNLNYTEATVNQAYEAFWENDGELPADAPISYETRAQVQARFLTALAKYQQYETVLIVTHGMLMRQFIPQKQIDYVDFLEIDISF